MPKINLSGMTIEALMDLRQRVDEMLRERRGELEKQLEKITAFAVVGGAKGCARRWKRITGKKSPAEIS
jgi:hypothetical protein